MKNETKTFIGPFAKHIENYLKEKQSIGDKIESYIYVLKSFDTFSNKFNCNLKYLTKELVLKWLELGPNEKESNLVNRACKIRGFSQYMNTKDKKSYYTTKGNLFT